MKNTAGDPNDMWGDAMRKTVVLKNGSEVLIREMKRDDLDRSLAFFRALPEDDRAYLRRGVTQREVVERRIQEMEAGSVLRLVADDNGEIVADGALEMGAEGWKDHTGEIRLIVGRAFQRQGLGALMARELYLLAAEKQVNEIIVKIMGPQVGVRQIFEHLGFHKETQLHDYVTDISGHKQDLIVMRCDLEALWKKLEDHFIDSDWQRTR